MVDGRAVVFDLDDTLYSWRSFQLSGFRAVADWLERDRNLAADAVFRLLWHASAHGSRGRELQVLCDRFSLPSSVVPELVDVIRSHTPEIRLPSQSIEVLKTLKPTWRLGILTNGLPAVQARKVKALGLDGLVEHVVYAEDHVSGGKPKPQGFVEILRRLNVDPASAVFVGDDETTDIAGALSVGMQAIHLASGPSVPSLTLAEAEGARVTLLRDVPAVAARLVERRRIARVA